jgi:hypothetical protein
LATFEAQVEALTGIAIGSSSTNPTQAELTQFLIDGVLDVTEKWLIGHPQDREQFTRISAEVTSNGSEKVGRADIIAVVRESGTNNDWRPCRKISPTQQSEVLDTESLSFASKYYPTYMVAEDGAISVFPVPEATTDAFKVYYVNYSPRADNDDSLTYASSGMLYFPQNKTYLVALYAAIKSINNNMAGIVTDLASFSVTAVPPDLPATGTSLPAYEAPSVSVSDGSIDAEISKMQDYIEDEEDVELAGVKGTELQLRFKRALDKFNSAMQTYQTENQGEIAHYSAEVQAYSAEVNAEVQEQQAQVQTQSTKYQWLQERSGTLQAEYTAAFSTPQQEQQRDNRGQRR